MKNYAIILSDAPQIIFGEEYPDFAAGLLKIDGKPVISHQIDTFKTYGIPESNITVVLGHESNSIAAYLNDAYPRVKLVHNQHSPFYNRCLALHQALHTIMAEQNLINTLYLALNACVFPANFLHSLASNNANNIFASGMHGAEKPFIYKINGQELPKILSGISRAIQNPDTPSCIFENLAQTTLFTEYKENQYGVIRIYDQKSLSIADNLLSSFDFKSKKAFFFDFDGTLFVGNTPIDGAIRFLKQYKDKFDFYFLTNNTSRTPEEYLGKLAKVDIHIDESQVVTPLHALFDYVLQKKYTSVYLIANQKVKEYVQKNLPGINLDFDMENNQAAVLAFDTELTYEKLKNLAIMLNNRPDVEYIATHGDFFCPHEQGPTPDVGGMIAMIQVTNGHIPHTVLGKPSVHLIQRYIDRYGKDSIVVVGDRLYTDKKLADNTGCDFICVLSGETVRADLLHNQSRYPAIVVSDLGQIDFDPK